MQLHKSWSTSSRLSILIVAFGISRFLLSANSRGKSGEDSQYKAKIEAIKQKGLKILIVDDEDRFRRAMATYLRTQFKISVKHVDSGRGAVQEFEKGNLYDVVFLDLNLSDQTGVQTFRELISRNVTTRIVFMSAYSNSEVWDEATQLGFNPLGKPISDEDFVRIFSDI
ncbi:MAG TPA: response regulator [Pyrinomonadaceae bacterium]|nr:response regulator [Pyrinomonadaceae bacterium]